MTAHFKTTDKKCEEGFLILEVLLAMVLLGIFGLGLARSTIVSLHMRKTTLIHQQANQLAINKLEEYSQVDTDTLNDGDSSYETSKMGALSYDINSSVSEESDGSKTIYVDVTAVSQQFPITVSLSSTYY